jgi:hypothetical protein
MGQNDSIGAVGMLKHVVRSGHSLKHPTFLFEATLYIAAVCEQGATSTRL